MQTPALEGGMLSNFKEFPSVEETKESGKGINFKNRQSTSEPTQNQRSIGTENVDDDLLFHTVLLYNSIRLPNSNEDYIEIECIDNNAATDFQRYQRTKSKTSSS